MVVVLPLEPEVLLNVVQCLCRAARSGFQVSGPAGPEAVEIVGIEVVRARGAHFQGAGAPPHLVLCRPDDVALFVRQLLRRADLIALVVEDRKVLGLGGGGFYFSFNSCLRLTGVRWSLI